MSADALFDVAGKTVLVTGGAQGLGRMIAEGFVRAGARTFITSRKPEIVAAAAAELSAVGLCEGVAADLSTTEATEALARWVMERTEVLHVLVNNAGRTWGEKLETFPAKAWAGVMAVNVQMPFQLMRDLLPLLERGASAEDPARVINIGSVAGKVVEPLNAYSYAASKAGLHHLSRTVAADIAARHVTVNVVLPGYFPSQMTASIRADSDKLDSTLHTVPMRRLGAPSDIQGVCLFLASRASAFITGAEIAVDGGLSGCR
jgi:NAD(P)-dependent dehydrogenase (short-subunit alcohol dehydrogenase family)